MSSTRFDGKAGLAEDTDEQGAFDVGPFLEADPGERAHGDPPHWMVVEAPRLAPAWIDVAALRSSECDRVVVVMDEGVKLAGRLLDDRDMPILGGTVSLEHPFDHDYRLLATTDAGGRWWFEHVPRVQLMLSGTNIDFSLGGHMELNVTDSCSDLVLRAQSRHYGTPQLEWSGLSLHEDTPHLLRSFRLRPQTGVVVLAVSMSASRADGLKVGDLIVSANGEYATSLWGFVGSMLRCCQRAKAATDCTLELRVRRWRVDREVERLVSMPLSVQQLRGLEAAHVSLQGARFPRDRDR